MSYSIDDGTFIATVGGTELELKLTYKNMLILDKKLNNMNTFLMKSSHNNISLEDVVQIFFYGSRKNHKDLSVTDIGELIFDEGIVETQITAINFLVFAMNGGKEISKVDEGEDVAEKKDD